MRVRAPRREKWHGSVRILRDGSLRFSPWTFPGLPHVSVFESEFSVDILSGGHQVLFLYPERHRVMSACFVYTLEPAQLRDAVRELRTVQGGLAGWIVPALQWTQDHLSRIKAKKDSRRELLQATSELLESCGDLPVAEAWQKGCRQAQREWVRHLREHPEDVDRLPPRLRNGIAPEVIERARRAKKARDTKRPRTAKRTQPR